MPRILVTNDDGWRAEGLHALATALVSIGEVTVVAPDHERSATGHAITVHKPLRIDEVPLPIDGLAGAFTVNGTPADCVKLAVQALLKETPDLVVSGINRGPNLGTDVLYSGTVSGAMEGLILGMPGIAFSLATMGGADYTGAADFATRIVAEVLARKLTPDLLLNINYPGCDSESVQGVRITRLGARKWQDVFERRTDPRGRGYYWMAGEAMDTDDSPEMDTVAVREGYISVTPIRCDLTATDAIPMIREWGLSHVGARTSK